MSHFVTFQMAEMTKNGCSHEQPFFICDDYIAARCLATTAERRALTHTQISLCVLRAQQVVRQFWQQGLDHHSWLS